MKRTVRGCNMIRTLCFGTALLVSFVLCALSDAAANQPQPAPAAPQNEWIVKSTYSNTNNRPDPFWPVNLKRHGPDTKASVDYGDLQLQGILWDPEKPIAVVSRQRIGLNESVQLNLRSGQVTVKAVSIQRTKVTLKIGDRQVELELER